MKQHSFHNTTGTQASELDLRESKAQSQDEDVLNVFKAMRLSRILTPEMVLRYLKDTKPKRYRNTPLTSIRRAFSNLKYRGLIEKSDLKTPGDYGMKVNCWKLV